MTTNEAGMQIFKLLKAKSPQSVDLLKTKFKKMQYTSDQFMDGFDYAVDKGWIDDFNSGVCVTARGLEEAGFSN